MQKLFLFLILFAVSNSAFSQKNSTGINSWRLTVIDSTTKKGIGGAGISMSGGKTFITNGYGAIAIDKGLLDSNEEISISCVGYRTLRFELQGQFPDTLNLSPSIMILRDVKIKFNLKKVLVGNANTPYDGGYLCGPNEEVAEYIPNTTRLNGTIQSVEFAINNGKKGIDKPFKVNLYAKMTDSLYPGDALITDSIIVYNREKHAIVSVNLSKYGIKIPANGFFVGFETLPPSWYGGQSGKLNGGKYLRVPGIKGHFNNHDFATTDATPKDAQYSLYRDISPSGSWSVFQQGTNFGIGATINSDE